MFYIIIAIKVIPLKLYSIQFILNNHLLITHETDY